MKSALRALVLTLLVLSTYALPAATGKLQSLPTYPTPGFLPYQIALGDFNHDGSPDMAVLAYNATSELLIMLNNGDGTFKPPVSYAAGSLPEAVAVGDFNGDGKLDLVVANGGQINAFRNMSRNAPGTCTVGCVMVLLGNGDGTFLPGLGFTVGAGASSVAVSDFNGDGKLDIVTSNNQANTVSVLLGNGDGNFQPAVNYNVAATPGLLAVGDFNGDHHPDIAVANDNSTGGVQVLLGKGDGTFQPAVTYSTGGTYDYSIAIADFNGDGKLDLAVGDVSAGFTGAVSILLGNGDGRFQSPQTLALNFFTTTVVSGDANGDGKADLIVSAGAAGFTVALGRGDGSFESPVSYSGFLRNGGILAVGDLNGDGKLDIASINSDNRSYADSGNGVSVILGFGDGTFSAPGLYPAVNNSTGMVGFGVVAADLNKDGFLDVAYGSGMLLGNGDGSFTAGASYSAGAAVTGIAADFNNDGNLDLAWANEIPKGTVYVQLGNGDGTFKKAVNNAAHKDPLSVVAADFNRDGVLDLATANWNSTDISVLLGKGDGTFNPATDILDLAYPEGIATGDFNGDGNPDLVVAGGGTASVLLGNGDGTFQPHVNYTVSGGADAVAVADINGDGKLDLVVSGINLSVLFGNGDGTFQPEIVSPAASDLHLLLADFNGDGKLDAVTIPFNGDLNESEPIAVQLGNGDGTFQPAVFYAAGDFPLNVTAGDFNGDGATDLAVSDFENSITILLNTGGTFLATTNAPNPSTLQQNVTFTTTVAASVKGQPVSTGKVTFMNGTTTLGSATLSNGQAIFTTSFSTSGQHQITPTYSGDSNFNPHTGTAVTQTVQAPTVNISPTKLNFGNQKVGTKSAPMSAKLTNRGSGALFISSITVAGSDYSVTNNCGSTLGQNKSCTLTVTFTPSTTGTRTGTISVTDNAANSPQKLFLTGSGT
jgi:Bacterial Ig-like domain (group 3)/FG-GAP-like repeat/Abnormal spindle-like microcephaly-assoc'd, ASPM-SPD-2-Hydin/FG-GAP repeat